MSGRGPEVEVGRAVRKMESRLCGSSPQPATKFPEMRELMFVPEGLLSDISFRLLPPPVVDK